MKIFKLRKGKAWSKKKVLLPNTQISNYSDFSAFSSLVIGLRLCSVAVRCAVREETPDPAAPPSLVCTDASLQGHNPVGIT